MEHTDKTGGHHHHHHHHYSALLSHLPPVDLAFAYGSGVFKQEGYDDDGDGKDYSRAPMLDLVFTVSDPVAWHEENLRRNWHHYSWLKYLGPETIAHVQEHYGAAIYYNTTVPCPDSFQRGRMMKYGVMSTQALQKDLVDWTWLYVAGRMHKPVQFLTPPPPSLSGPIHTNLRNAVRTSLLLLPQTFTDSDLFTMIAGLSYRGDPRMAIAENPRKVKNIVAGSLSHFHDLYMGIVREEKDIADIVTTTGAGDNRFEQDKSPSTRAHLIRTLPRAILDAMRLPPPPPSSPSPPGVVGIGGGWWETMPERKVNRIIKVGIHRVVAGASWRQSLKGVVTAGVVKAFMYGMKKVDKMRRGLLQQQQHHLSPQRQQQPHVIINNAATTAAATATTVVPLRTTTAAAATAATKT